MTQKSNTSVKGGRRSSKRSNSAKGKQLGQDVVRHPTVFGAALAATLIEFNIKSIDLVAAARRYSFKVTPNQIVNLKTGQQDVHGRLVEGLIAVLKDFGDGDEVVQFYLRKLADLIADQSFTAKSLSAAPVIPEEVPENIADIVRRAVYDKGLNPENRRDLQKFVKVLVESQIVISLETLDNALTGNWLTVKELGQLGLFCKKKDGQQYDIADLVDLRDTHYQRPPLQQLPIPA